MCIVPEETVTCSIEFAISVFMPELDVTEPIVLARTHMLPDTWLMLRTEFAFRDIEPETWLISPTSPAIPMRTAPELLVNFEIVPTDSTVTCPECPSKINERIVANFAAPDLCERSTS